MDLADLVGRRRKEILGGRIPHLVTFELTHRCNLRCVHCYCPPRAERRGELTLEEYEALFDKLVELGTMEVCLTGGDPLLRRDFAAIYRAAKERGFLLIIFTNAALVDESILDLWTAYRPRRVEITLYGRSEAVYTAVTRVPGAYEKCYENVRALVERGIDVELKTIALKQTKEEVWEMRRFADELGLPFKWDGKIHPRLDGSFEPLVHRLHPSDLADLEAQEADGLEGLRRRMDEVDRIDAEFDTVFCCGAGVNSFTVDPYGRMGLCTIMRKPDIDIVNTDILDVWNGSARAIRLTPRGSHPIDPTGRGRVASPCPAVSLLESGNMETQSEWLLDLQDEEHRRVERARPQSR
jgi:MoaA/NifB/PqqE/SkfB family radical SAM enzyme